MKTVVIGHGRSPEGKGWGRYIDRMDTVVRMWDYTWQSERDYGRHYDYGLFELYPAVFVNFKRYNKKTPTRGWIASLLRGGDAIPPPPNTEIIKQERWCRIGRVMGGLGVTGRLELTRGTIAALWAIEQSSPGDQVILVGFDNIKKGAALPLDEAFCKEYQENPGSYPFDKYESGCSKYGNHDYAIELPLMEKIAGLLDVGVSFAEDIWRVDRPAAFGLSN